MPFGSGFEFFRYRLYHGVHRSLEWIKYAVITPSSRKHFWVISCSWNSGSSVLNCIESVYRQRYDRSLLTHLFIDDHSSDDTQNLISAWMQEHPDHNLIYIRNDTRVGGTKNTLRGFRMVPEGAIVVELNGDDWLPDAGVIPFLNKVYADDDVWMTYNSYRFADREQNRIEPVMLRPVPAAVVAKNSIREHAWMTRHLHSFRRELLDHLKEETFIDPETGKYWDSADDQAIYLSLFELAGTHAVHLFRTMYVYNYRSLADDVVDLAGSRERMKRIRLLDRYQPLTRL